MDGINFGLLGDNAFESYKKFQNADTQKQLNQQQLAQAQQATRLGAAQEAGLQRKGRQETLTNAIRDIAGFNTREEVIADMNRKRQSGELDSASYDKVYSTLPPDDSGIHPWKTKMLRGLLSVKEQLDAEENDKQAANLNQMFGMGAPAPVAPAPVAPAPVAPVATTPQDRFALAPGSDSTVLGVVAPTPQIDNRTNKLAPPPVENVNQLTNTTMPTVKVIGANLPVMPSEEQAAMMAGSSHKGTAEAGQRILQFYASQPEVTKLQGQINRMLAQGVPKNDPQVAQLEARIKQISTHAPLVNINTGQQLEKAEQIKKGEFNVGEYKDISETNRANTKLLPALDIAERILNKGFETGFGTETKVAGARLLSALGVPDANKYATDAATFQTMLTQTVLQRQLEQKGVATEGDAQRIADTSAKLSNPVDANKFILATARATVQRDQEHKKFYDTWWAKNKTYEGASDAWDSGPANKSIFTYPALKAYAPKETAPAAQAPTVDKNIPPVPNGLDPNLWKYLSPAERKLWVK